MLMNSLSASAKHRAVKPTHSITSMSGQNTIPITPGTGGTSPFSQTTTPPASATGNGQRRRCKAFPAAMIRFPPGRWLAGGACPAPRHSSRTPRQYPDSRTIASVTAARAPQT